MITRLIGWFLAITFLIFAFTVSGEQSDPPEQAVSKTNVQLLMQDKLKHAQLVLDGIVTDDYEKIEEQTEMMRMISRAASWQAIDTEEYKNHSNRFQRINFNLKNAALEKNHDAVTLQYIRLTMACIECHQYMHDQSISKEEN